MLETHLVAVIKGKQFYQVMQNGRALFTGTLGECKRFSDLHMEKVEYAARDRRIRHKPEAKIYRVRSRPLAASGT